VEYIAKTFWVGLKVNFISNNVLTSGPKPSPTPWNTIKYPEILSQSNYLSKSPASKICLDSSIASSISGKTGIVIAATPNPKILKPKQVKKPTCFQFLISSVPVIRTPLVYSKIPKNIIPLLLIF